MIVGCYSMDLYCDECGFGYGTDSASFAGETRGQCVRQARLWGWLVGRERQLCPKCSGKRRRPQEES